MNATVAGLVPIVCCSCGQRGDAPLASITAGAKCACGSDDLDLDMTHEGSWETDMPMNTLQDTEVVTQPAKCSNCLTYSNVTATDPAAPMPPCPNCGADLLTPAGATLAAKEAKIAEIVAGILKTNPSMPPSTAKRVARETVERFPRVARSRG
jgi:hypothetical protein